MNEYIALNNQNFYDIVLMLYGNLDGMHDLLKNNDWLHPDYICSGGEKIIYDSSKMTDAAVVSYYSNNNIIPINGSRDVFHKIPKTTMAVSIAIEKSIKNFSVSYSGYGVIEIDFGDNSAMHLDNMSNKEVSIDHFMDNDISENRTIRIYTDGEISSLGIKSDGQCIVSGINDTVVSHISITGFESINNMYFSSILKRVRSVFVKNVKIKDINGLSKSMFLNEISLESCSLSRKMLDNYLISVCKNYGLRPSAKVFLGGNETPSGIYKQPLDLQNPLTGMEAVWVLENDENRLWKFDFGNRFIYKIDAKGSINEDISIEIKPGDKLLVGGGNASTKC